MQELNEHFFITLINDRVIQVDSITFHEWLEFKKWVENTSLFNAIKNDPSGTEIRAIDGSLTLHLGKHNVEEAEDLPIEVLYTFYQNSPWFKTTNNIQKLLTK